MLTLFVFEACIILTHVERASVPCRMLNEALFKDPELSTLPLFSLEQGVLFTRTSPRFTSVAGQRLTRTQQAMEVRTSPGNILAICVKSVFSGFGALVGDDKP